MGGQLGGHVGYGWGGLDQVGDLGHFQPGVAAGVDLAEGAQIHVYV